MFKKYTEPYNDTYLNVTIEPLIITEKDNNGNIIKYTFRIYTKPS